MRLIKKNCALDIFLQTTLLAITFATGVPNAQAIKPVDCLVKSIGTFFQKREIRIRPQLNPFEKSNLIENFKFMGFTDKGYHYVTFGNPDQWELALYHGVAVKAKSSKAHKEVLQIILGKYKNADALKLKLNAWARRNKIGFEFAFFNDVVNYGRTYEKLGKISSKRHIRSNGFIAQDLYMQMVRDGIYPIADPHDLLSHLSSLAEPDFVRSFKKFSSLMEETGKSIGYPEFALGDGSLNRLITDAAPRAKAQAMVYRNLLESVRDTTHENWSYLITKEGIAPELFLQGGPGFNSLVNGLMRNDRDAFVEGLFNSQTFSDVNFSVKNLPSFSTFSKSAEGKQVTESYLDALDRNLWGADEVELAKKRVNLFIERENLMPGARAWDRVTDKSQIPLDRAATITKKLAAFMASDAKLSSRFSQKNKQRLFDATLQFYRSYLDWVKAGNL